MEQVPKLDKNSERFSIPGPSNIPGTSIQSYTTGRKHLKCISVMKCPDGSSKKQTWKCKLCEKQLSSKRSYTEHMNIHNKTRPFQCDSCEYAAASQMTLHRHKLRNHTPKAEWGYKCPYCEEPYMEPAGYQQHVQHRHTGLSATYGCPFTFCKFSSKSQRHFREHLMKHEATDKIEGNVNPCSLSSQQLNRYMINDECGYGYERKKKPIYVRPRQIQAVAISPRVYMGASQNSVALNNQNPAKIMWQLENVQTFPANHVNLSAHQNRDIKLQYVTNHQVKKLPTHNKLFVDSNNASSSSSNNLSINRIIPPEEDEDDGPPVLDRQQEEPMLAPDTDWIEAEIEVTSNNVQTFPNGLVEEELD